MSEPTPPKRQSRLKAYSGYSPRRLREAGIDIAPREDFWVRDRVTHEVRILTAAEWTVEMSETRPPV